MRLNRCPLLIANVIACLIISGCSSLPDGTQWDSRVEKLVPTELQANDARESHTASGGWLESLQDPAVTELINEAIASNFSLQTARYRVEAARQARRISGASMLPQLSLEGSGNRARDNRPEISYSNQYGVTADLSWELDLWGKNLSSFQAQDLLYQAQQATFRSARLSLASQIVRAWYQAITDQQLSELLSRRVKNLTDNLDIIGSGYRSGLNNAVDVYLARSDLASERSNLSAQRETARGSIRQLQLLLGRYPSGTLHEFSLTLPTLPALPDLSEGLTSERVLDRYDVLASYLQLAAADRQTAAAHRARFPSLTIVASAGDSASASSQLFDGRSLAWNIIGGITQPLFYGGRLAAQQRQAEAELRQTEQLYLDTVYNAFSEIETALTNERSLTEQMEQLDVSRVDAEAALDLAFSQYRRGLTSYSDVLEAQRRAFSARSSLLTTRNLLLQNRINLYLAVGADFDQTQ